VVILVLTIISSINLYIKRYYIEVVESSLIIHRDYFRTTSINLNNIEKISIEPGSFTSIILKDKTEVKFVDTDVDLKKLREFLAQLRIPIVG
jgi:hypothetical protein